MRRVRRAFVALLVLALAARVAAAPEQPEEENPARARLEALKPVFTLARAATRDIPRDTFDPDAVLSETGTRDREILGWVAARTEWMPYRGSLRGWRGVLMDRVGSHLDRALLLAELLQRAGQTVRIERGTIPAGDVDAILERLAGRKPVEETSEPPSEDELAARLAEIARILGVPLERVRRDHESGRVAAEQRQEDITLRTALLADVLARSAGIESEEAKPGMTAEQRELLRDHFRVGVKHGSNWMPLDPLAEKLAPGESVFEEPTATFAPDAIPAELRHTLRVRVLAERSADGELSRAVVLDHVADAAALLGKKVTLRMKALDWPLDLPKITLDAERMGDLSNRTQRALEEQHEWLPVLDLDDEVVRQKSFRDDGSVVDSPAISLQARKVGRATSALGDLGTAGADGGQLSGVLVELVFRAPGREPVREERAWIDLVGEARRAAGDGKLDVDAAAARARAVGLGGMMSFLALPCRPSEAWLAHRRAGALLENRVPILGALYAVSRGEGDRVSRYLDRARPAPMELYALAGSRFEGRAGDGVYVDGLEILSSFTLPEHTEDGLVLRQGLDLIRTRLAARPDGPVDGRTVRFRQGVRDTVAESRTLPRRVGVRVNAADRLARDVAAGKEWIALRSADELAAAKTALDPDATARVRDALERGLVVVAPPGPAGDEEAAWWEIDPASGAAIGRIAGGRGGMAEETVLMVNDAYSLIRTMSGVLSCRGKEDLEMACCLLQNAAFGAYGLALGGAFAGVISDMWGVALNVAYTETTGMIDLCGS